MTTLAFNELKLGPISKFDPVIFQKYLLFQHGAREVNTKSCLMRNKAFPAGIYLFNICNGNTKTMS